MRLRFAWVLSSIVTAAVVAAVGCDAGGGGSKFSTAAGGAPGGTGAANASNGSTNNSASAGNGGSIGSFASGAGAGMTMNNGNAYQTQPICTMGTCQDFPQAPIIADSMVPSNAATLFGAATNYTPPTSATPLCVLEPQLGDANGPGAMIPSNWVEPRFRVNATGLNLFEIRITSPWEQYPLVVYSTSPEWYMPKSMWSGTTDLDAGYASGTGLGNNAADAPLTVTVRGINTATAGMVPVGVSGDFNIAPVVATGSMVFWTVQSSQVTPTSSQLFGFKVGDEGVQVAMTLGQLSWRGQPGEDGAELRGYYSEPPDWQNPVEGQVQCMGCHAGTPDGSAVVFVDNWSWVKGAALLPTATSPGGAIPTTFAPTSADAGTITFGAGAQAMFKTPWWGTQTMSRAHWAPGDAILVSSYGVSFQGSPPAFTTGQQRTSPWESLPYYDSANSFLDDKVNYHQLAWINMESNATIDVSFPATPDYGQQLTNRQNQAKAAEGSAWGLIPTGDTMSDVLPAMSNLPGTNVIAYVETDFSPDGHPDYTAKQAMIKTVPYNNHGGGTATPLPGASDAAHLNYYPTFSADDQFIAFTQAPAPDANHPDGPYYNRDGQIMIIPAAGGTAISLAANTPNACGGDPNPAQVLNSWPKWSPDVVSTKTATSAGKTYYFLIFSSGRLYKDEFSEQFQLTPDPASDFTGLHISSQLYLAAIVVDNTTQQITTYPAVYIWNQNRTPGSGNTAQNLQYSNLTPAWAPFALPPLVITPPTQVQ